ncbi:hypothetical protein HK096_004023, partial [Nowakowskiella sp. JEL0078]
MLTKLWLVDLYSQLFISCKLTKGPNSPDPGVRPKLICVERPHGGGRGKYPPNPNVEPDNSRTNTAEIDIFASAGSPVSSYAKLSKAFNNPFCGGHAQMSDGNIFMSGGDKEYYNDPVSSLPLLIDGTNINRIYSPLDSVSVNTNPWTTTSTAMAVGRWYPSVTTLDDGSQIIVGGVSSALNLDNWAAGNKTLNPTYEFYPQRGFAVNLPILTQTDPWNLYPFVQQLPISGKIWIFSGGPSILLNATTGATISLPSMKDTLHHPRGIVKIYPFTPTTVMLPLRPRNNYTAIFMLCGGTLRDTQVNTTIKSSGYASNYCSQISPEDTSPSWKENFIQWPGSGKVMPDSVLLPDGKVLFVNGATWGTAGGDAGVCDNAHDPSFQTFIFDPETIKFERAPDFTVGRLYHSAALLLPDGRVIATGSEEANYVDFPKILENKCFPFTPTANFTNSSSLNNDLTAGCSQPFEYRIEMFTPAYYNKSGKPVITSGYGIAYPSQVTYGSNFAVKFNTNAKDVASISFIRYSTVTHSLNLDQRFVELPILFSNTSHVFINAPINATIAPPGNWMLFPVAASGAVGHSITIRLKTGSPVRLPVPVSSGNSGTSSRLRNVKPWRIVGSSAV